MSTDLITRLRAALDQVQHLAEEVQEAHRITNEDHERFDEIGWPRPRVTAVYQDGPRERWASTLDYFAAWSPARVLKLIERDRALLAELEEADAYYTADVAAPAGEAYGLRTAVKLAAAFWLGEDTE